MGLPSTIRHVLKMRLVVVLLLANIFCAQALVYSKKTNSERKISNSPRVDPNLTGTKCSLTTYETTKRNIMDEKDFASNVSLIALFCTSRLIFLFLDREPTSQPP
jgi:hypothetical protein